MQIQRTGYQQNFGTATAAPIDESLLRGVFAIDQSLSRIDNPECRFIPYLDRTEGIKMLFVDGDESRSIHEIDRNWTSGLYGDELEKRVNTILADPKTIIQERKILTLSELLERVPMLRKFGAAIANFLR